jgi:hypothetical protein
MHCQQALSSKPSWRSCMFLTVQPGFGKEFVAEFNEAKFFLTSGKMHGHQWSPISGLNIVKNL